MNFTKAQVDRFLKEPDPKITAVLFYGPDQGLAHERARQLIHRVLGGMDDPFRLAEMSAKEVGDDPARLADELNAIAMLGGRRVVSVAPSIDGRANEPFGAALKEILSNHTAPQATLLVVEAGDLPQRHGLVQVFEQAPTAFAARCFHDAGQDLRPLIEETLRQSGYEATAEAMAFLAQHLGDDRGVTRSELGKLCLYIGDKKKRIEIEDVVACIGDQAAIQLDDLLMAIADGDLQGVEKIYDRCVVDSEPVALLRAASRHFARLHLIAGRMKEGESFERVAASLRPPLFWAIRSKVEKQCRSWDVASIAWAINRLIDAEATTMKHYPIASTVARHALVDIAARRPKSGSVVRSISRG